MKILKTGSITVLLIACLTGCRDFVILEDFEFPDPVGRVVQEEKLVLMPGYQQSSLICSRTDLYLSREGRLANLDKAIKGVNSDLRWSAWWSNDCGIVARADCLYCDTEYDYECEYDPDEGWLEAMMKTRDEAKRNLVVLERKHKQAYQACFEFVEKLTFKDRYDLHKSALEPPEFLPTEIGAADL